MVGFDVEIAQAIAERLGVKAEFLEGKWDGLIAGLDAKRYDAVINQVGITEARKAKYDFSDPYIASKAVLIVRGDNTDIKSFADLKGKKAAQSLTSNFGKLAETNGAELVGTDGFDQSIQLLLTGRADATINDSLSFLDFKKQKPDANVKIAAQEENADYSGVIVRKGDPELVAAINQALADIKADGTYIPMAMGTKDLWEAATMGYQNIGPNYWKGEEGRLALIKGEQKLTDPQWVAPFAELAKWKPYLGDGFEAQTYPDSQNLFTLGRAAIYPAGSWEIGLFNTQAQFKMGAFPPPVQKAGDTCYISDHTDIGMGLNAASKNADAAKTFLSWVASPDFATIYANALPGFFSLNNTPVKMEDPLAQEFVSWRDKCKSTIRSTYQILGRGTPNLENETWVESANVINGTVTPEAAAKKLQDGLDSWYKPAK
ncbi:MAG: extracellular solute-binding protein [Mesorhizobium sp.]|nr:MAG: extracellular solute-binding protein [Mesorhizobium sp.]